MMHYHAVVWIDHHEAHVQSFTHDETERTFIVETMDHPTDGQLLEHARRFFRAADRMLP